MLVCLKKKHSFYLFFAGVYCKCKESYPVKAKLRYDYYDYFSFTSTEADVDDMLKGSREIYTGPFMEDVRVTIESMLYTEKLNVYVIH